MTFGLAPQVGDLQETLSQALELALRLVAREEEPWDPVASDPQTLRARLALRLQPEGQELPEVIAELERILRATPATSSWRFVNQLFGGREPTAVAAELLTAVANVSMYTFKAAGAQVLVEDELIRHMAAKLGMPAAEGSFAPGGSLANLVALLLGRDAMFPNARDQGMPAQRVAVYASTESHYSVPKSLAVLGLGRNSLRLVQVDSRGRLRGEALRTAMATDLAAGVKPLAVIATAGTTVRGAMDPLSEIAKVAQEAGAWMHVDAALGGSFALSPKHCHWLEGVAEADSVSWNPHKLMGIPLQASILFVRHRGALAASLDQSADYLFQNHGEEFNPGHRSLQCGRRNDALKLWAAWRHLGDQGWAARMEAQIAMARFAASQIAADPVMELVEEPASINVCFTVNDQDPAILCERLYRNGRLSIGHGMVGETRVLRLVCVNPSIGREGIRQILAEVRAAASH
jgi:glutamate/tyrosine decarboxylase-like PLP-dependent enzyme